MSIEQVLEKVVACLQHEQIHFGIGGSLLLHHHGLPVTPRDIDLDLMSGLQVRHDEGVFVYPFDEQSIDSAGLPFMALVDWYVIYQLIPGREQKVTMIEDVFTKQEVDRERLEQLRRLNLPQDVSNRIDQWLN